jgi:predicted dehydrogenase
MFRLHLAFALVISLAGCGQPPETGAETTASTGDELRLIVLDPGHFHASLLQKEMYAWLSPQVSVYAPVGPDLPLYLNRVIQFNRRAENPTQWELDIHAAPDFAAWATRERPGDLIMMSGKNQQKMNHIEASLAAGLHVLADKPWVARSADIPKVEAALKTAGEQGLAAYDIMTERYEITCILQRELVNDHALFGELLPGTAEAPGIQMKSIHHLMKQVAGSPLLRPVWFFDVNEAGEGLSDVGVHVVDLAQWIPFPDQEIDYQKDVRMLSAKHWPTVLSRDDFRQVTGTDGFPDSLAESLKADCLEYYCNNFVHYTIRGVHIKLDVLWNWKAPEGSGDVFESTIRGSKARAEIRQGAEEVFRPELYLIPNSDAAPAEVFAALEKRVEALQQAWPGVTVEIDGNRAHIVIPERHRVGHEEHFAQVTNQFHKYLLDPQSIPQWEKTNMLAKYYISTRGVELARESSATEALQ